VGGEGAQALSPEPVFFPSPQEIFGPNVYWLEGLSDKTMLDIGLLLLSHASLLGAGDIQVVYTAREFYPTRLFSHPGTWGAELWPQLRAIITEIGNNLMTGMGASPDYGVGPHAMMIFFQNQALAWSLIVNQLWPGAVRVWKLTAGAAEFTPTVYHLRDVKPAFGPSTAYAEFLRDAGDIDATGAAEAAAEIMSRYFQVIERPFPRLRNLDAQLTSEL